MFIFTTFGYINRINPLQLIINKINEFIEKSDGNKYLMVAPTDESKKRMKKCGTKSGILLDQ